MARQGKKRGGAPGSQRDFMYRLWKKHKGDKSAVVRAWVQAELKGEVARKSNTQGQSPEAYARRLISDGITKGWLEAE